jgi:uracil-DNA glycosylase
MTVCTRAVAVLPLTVIPFDSIVSVVSPIVLSWLVMTVVQPPLSLSSLLTSCVERTFSQMSLSFEEPASVESSLSVEATSPAVPVKLPLLAVLEPVSEQPPSVSDIERATNMSAGRRTPQSLRERRLAALTAEVVDCRRCPRLVAWREQVAREKRAAFAGEEYWGRPVPGFGDPHARIAILGLAPAAHGANRTGRMFTGDRSGDFLYAALARAGLASQPTSRSRDDGLALRDCWISAAVRCAPPANRPSPAERDNCLPWARRELELLADVRVIVCLGGFAWDAALRLLAPPRPWPRFAHGAESAPLLGCYHPSQQNTFTGRLTESMIDAVLARALALARAV